ncbi:MAG: hypothetical protein ABIF77_07910 [bacterium]
MQRTKHVGWSRTQHIVSGVVVALAVVSAGLGEATAQPVLETTSDARTELITSLLEDQDFVFVIIANSDAGPDSLLSTQVSGARQRIAAEGVAVDTRILLPDDPRLMPAVVLFNVPSLPAVLAIKKDGESDLVLGEPTELNLLQVYVRCCGGETRCGKEVGRTPGKANSCPVR